VEPLGFLLKEKQKRFASPEPKKENIPEESRTPSPTFGELASKFHF
jgi:hypothetical protein